MILSTGTGLLSAEDELLVSQGLTGVFRQADQTFNTHSTHTRSSSSSINLSCDRSIASSKVLERDCPGKVIMW
jgi:hypothetical protein